MFLNLMYLVVTGIEDEKRKNKEKILGSAGTGFNIL